MEKVVEALRATGFADDIEGPHPADRVNVVRVDFTRRMDRGDPFTRTEREQLRDWMDFMEQLTASGGCPIAAKVKARP
jgi:hypothetical protein